MEEAGRRNFYYVFDLTGKLQGIFWVRKLSEFSKNKEPFVPVYETKPGKEYLMMKIASPFLRGAFHNMISDLARQGMQAKADLYNEFERRKAFWEYYKHTFLTKEASIEIVEAAESLANAISGAKRNLELEIAALYIYTARIGEFSLVEMWEKLLASWSR